MTSSHVALEGQRALQGPLVVRFAWCLYDWAYSAFSTIVTTFVFATYFVRAVATDPASGIAAWAAAQSAAGMVIACLAVPAGAIADQGPRRSLLAAATVVMILATACLWFIHPETSAMPFALALVATATVAFELGTIFYNAILPDIAPPGSLGRLSGIAWGAGYAGGLVCLSLCLLLLVNPKPPLFGLSARHAEPVRATMLFAAAWIALFSWPILLLAPRPLNQSAGWRAIRSTMRTLAASLRAVASQPALRGFLIARMLYTDGLATLFAFGGVFAAGTFAMDARQVLLLGIVMNVSAGFGALAFALVEDRLGSRVTILITVLALAAAGILALAAPIVRVFWAAAIVLGLFVGPAQAASRSFMARIAAPEVRNAMFGLYALSGRVTGFIGPAMLGAITALTGSQRAGMAGIVVLLLAGWIILAATPIRATNG